jgi:hypothetical protein
MNLTNAQLQTLKTNINNNADPEFVVYRNNGQTNQMANWYNVASAFIVYKTSELSAAIGTTVNYLAVAALTDANVNKLRLFVGDLNPETFAPNHSDQRQFMTDIFSGALGGQGQATRDALDALYRRPALRGEQLYTTGLGTTVSPGALVVEGDMTPANISAALALP